MSNVEWVGCLFIPHSNVLIINAVCEYFLAVRAFLGVMSSPKSLALAPMRGALFGKNLTFFSESVGDLKNSDSRLKRAGMTILTHDVNT